MQYNVQKDVEIWRNIISDAYVGYSRRYSTVPLKGIFVLRGSALEDSNNSFLVVYLSLQG